MQEEKRKQSSPGIVSVEGHLDKKSPAHNLWQSRWFKIQTRENNVSDEYNEDNFTPYSYQLMWYKKKGGAVLKSMDCSTIIKLSIIQCNRPLAWLATSRRIILQSEVDDSQPDAMPIFCGDESSCPVTGVSASSSSSYVFSVVEIGGKEHILRASKMDKMVGLAISFKWYDIRIVSFKFRLFGLILWQRFQILRMTARALGDMYLLPIRL